MNDLIQDNDTGAWDVEQGAKLYSGSYEDHFIDGELTEVFVFYYSVNSLDVWYEDGEMHTSVDLAVMATDQTTITSISLDLEDIEDAINHRQLEPTDLSYTKLLEREQTLTL